MQGHRGGELLARPGKVAAVEGDEPRIEQERGRLALAGRGAFEGGFRRVESTQVIERLCEMEVEARCPGLETARRFEGVGREVEALQADRALAGQPLELRIAGRLGAQRNQHFERGFAAAIAGQGETE